MTSRPVVRQTYGSKVPRSSSSSSLIFEDISASSLAWRSSSPPSSSFIGILPPSSPPEWTGDRSRDSSPLFPEAQEDGVIPACPGHSDQDSEDDDECDGGSRSVQQKKLRSGVNAKAPAVQSTIRGFFTPLSRKKRPLHPAATVSVLSSSSQSPSHLRAIHLPPSKSTISKSSLTQLHLTHLPLLHTCKECGMSFVRGSEDEGLHRKHHARVMRGIIWDGLGQGRHKGKGRADGGWRVVRDGVSFGAEKGKGKIVVCDGSWGGSKLDDILGTIDTVLSSPPSPQSILDVCKIFLFITSSTPPLRLNKRPRLSECSDERTKVPSERVVGVVVAQGIKWAMRVLRPGEEVEGGARAVDTGGGVVCDPSPLPTPLGIHRLFTVPAYRSLGLAHILLDAASSHTVYGYTFDPKKGEVAFSQPTDSGRAVMEKWGGGRVRVFVDDESQL